MQYNPEISSKTYFLNRFRSFFRNNALESFLINKIDNNSPDSFWGRVCPPNYLYKTNSIRNVSRGGIKFDLDISDYVEHYIYFGFQDSSIDQLLNISKNDGVIIDVGANIGLTALKLAKQNPAALIIGFEPDIKNFRKAEKNVLLNSFDNIKLYNYGLGEVPAKLKLQIVNENNAGMNRILHSTTELSAVENTKITEISVIKLDDFILENNLSEINLIKIDVEGFEFKVLKGAEKTLQAFKPALFIELDDNNLREQESSAKELLSFLKNLGYTFLRADDNLRITADDNFENCHFDIICRVPQTDISRRQN